MKKIYTLLLAVLITTTTFAQAPEKMSYQAVVRDSGGDLVISQQVGMQISILQSDASGTAVYTETQTPTTNANGLVTLEIGTGTLVSGNFTTIDWSAGPYFIKTEIDPTGGSSYSITGTSQLLSVPYALHAKQAANGLPVGGTEGQILAINISGTPEWQTPIEPINTTMTITTEAISNGVAITGGGNITASDTPVIMRGLVVSTSPNPTTTTFNVIFTNGPGVGSYVTYLANLTDNTTYYVRAFANNSEGTAYGNEVSFTSIALPAIGETYRGGILAYVLQSGDPGYDANVPHGLIVAPSDQSTGIEWSVIEIATGATGVVLGTGNTNTEAIVAVLGNGSYAARLCYDLELNGYSDWFLPSINELNKLYLNNVLIGGFVSNSYWSSTEYNSKWAFWKYLIQGLDGYSGYTAKNAKFHYVRAVRAF